MHITYVSELPSADGIIRLQIPTSISPRYASPRSDPVKIDKITPTYTEKVPYGISINIKAHSGFVSAIESPSHKISSSLEGDYMIVSLADNHVQLDRDFILELVTRQQNDPVCLLASHENKEMSALFRFYPHFEEISTGNDVKSEVIFVLDCSGSMSGSSIAEAKMALELSLRSLEEGDRFNIIRFESSYELFSSESEIYTDTALKKAIRYINGIDADMGGTELKEAVSYVCSLPTLEGYVRDMLLITDGEVSNPDEVIHFVSSARNRMRAFTFGIGYGASHHLVKGVARAGGGTFEMIQPGEKTQSKVLRQFARMSQPFLTDISVTFSGADIELPRQFPPLFEGDSYTFFMKVESAEPDAEVTFTGKYLEQVYSWETRLSDTGTGKAIPSLWALSRIRELEETGAEGSGQSNRKLKKIVGEITDIGLHYKLLTDYTSTTAIY